jgi:hypothetical protein
MSLIVTVLYIYLMSAFVEPLAWLMIAATQIGLSTGALFFYKRSVGGGITLGVVALLFGLYVFCGFNSLK